MERPEEGGEVKPMQWLGSILSFLEKVGLRGPVFFFFSVVSGLLLYMSDSWLSRLRLLDLRKTYSIWIEVIFIAATVLTLTYATEWLLKTIRHYARLARINRSRRNLLNGLSTVEHQLLEHHFLRDGLRENTVIISNTSNERDVLFKLREKRIVVVTPMRPGGLDWRASPASVTIAPWAWKIMNSSRYKPNLTGVDGRR